MNYNFTFKTEDELNKAERAGFDDSFDIVRVVTKSPDGNTHDIPIKSEEAFNTYMTNVALGQVIEKIYQSKHIFDHGKYDYLNYLDENKKAMKKVISKKDLAKYIQERVNNLYTLEVLKEEKEKIEKDLKVLSEGKKKYNPWAVCSFCRKRR